MNPNHEMLNLILDRRSCNSYLPDPLNRSVLESIVQAGRHAPSGMNRQMTHFYVVTDPTLLAEITRVVSENLPGFSGCDCRYGAPALIIVANRKENPMAIQDASCAMQNMMLAACALGIGSRWINQPYWLSNDPDLRALLAPAGLTDDERICASLALGLPAAALFPGRLEHTGNPVTWVPEL